MFLRTSVLPWTASNIVRAICNGYSVYGCIHLDLFCVIGFVYLLATSLYNLLQNIVLISQFFYNFILLLHKFIEMSSEQMFCSVVLHFELVHYIYLFII